MTEKTDKMLEKVRALLAKADSTTFPAEADTFRAKADALMTAYAIEQWQVDQAQAGTNQHVKPEMSKLDFSWFYRNPRQDELWDLYYDTAYHCRVVVGLRGLYGRQMPIIGLPSDVAYFDMLFTSLMLEMGKNLEPKPQPGQSYIEALVTMKEAGMKWERIGNLLIDAGLMEGPYTRNVGVRFTKDYTDYCEANDRPRLNVAPSVYQRSFAEGFVDRVGERFSAMRQQQRTATEDDGAGMALAVRDIRQQANELYLELFPPPEPRKGGRVSTGVSRSLAFSQAAERAGRAAGDKVNLSSSPGRGLRNQKGLKS